MEKPPIDPILRKQYDEEINRVSSEAAKRAVMNIPKEALMATPDHQLTTNPDREAEQKSEEAFMKPNTQKWLNDGNEIAAKKEINKEYQRKMNTNQLGSMGNGLGPSFRGTTENFVGDIENSVFTKFEVDMIKSKENEVLDSMDESDGKFIDKLPQGNPMPSAEELQKLKERPGGLFAEKPFDQDKAA